MLRFSSHQLPQLEVPMEEADASYPYLCVPIWNAEKRISIDVLTKRLVRQQ